MSFTTRDEFEVLHGLRIKGMAQPEDIAVALGLGEDIVCAVLDHTQEHGGVRARTSGRVQGYMLTSTGRERHGELLADNVPDQLDGLRTAYSGFLEPNRAFKALTSKWQTEADGDITVVLPDLRAVHDSVTAVLASAADSVPRMKNYEPRFGKALDAFATGETSALARPMSGSYHDVWMELHEDFLLVLGRERSEADE